MDADDIAKNTSLANHLAAHAGADTAGRKRTEDSEIVTVERPASVSSGNRDERENRQESGSRTGTTQARDGNVPVAKRGRKIVDSREKALRIFDQIGNEYKDAYDSNGREVADRNLMLALRKHQRALIDGGIYTAKELDDRVSNLQECLKSSGNDGTASMEDLFHRWLNEPTVAVQ